MSRARIRIATASVTVLAALAGCADDRPAGSDGDPPTASQAVVDDPAATPDTGPPTAPAEAADPDTAPVAAPAPSDAPDDGAPNGETPENEAPQASAPASPAAPALTRPPPIDESNRRVCRTSNGERPVVWCVDRLTREFSIGGRTAPVSFTLPGESASNDIVDVVLADRSIYLIAQLDRNSDSPRLERSRFDFGGGFIDTRAILTELADTDRRLLVTTERRVDTLHDATDLRRIQGKACRIENGADRCTAFVATVALLSGDTVAYREFASERTADEVLASIAQGDSHADGAVRFSIEHGDAPVTLSTAALARVDAEAAPALAGSLDDRTIDHSLHWLGDLLSGRSLQRLGRTLAGGVGGTPSGAGGAGVDARIEVFEKVSNALPGVVGPYTRIVERYRFAGAPTGNAAAAGPWRSVDGELVVDGVEPGPVQPGEAPSTELADPLEPRLPSTRFFDWRIDAALVDSGPLRYAVTDSRASHEGGIAIDDAGASRTYRHLDFDLRVAGVGHEASWTVRSGAPIREWIGPPGNDWNARPYDGNRFVVTDALGNSLEYLPHGRGTYRSRILIDGELSWRIEPRRFMPILRGVNRTLARELD